MRRRRRGEFLTDIQCLWGKTDAPTESELLNNNQLTFEGYQTELLERTAELHATLFTKYFGHIEKAQTPTTQSKPKIQYNPYWSRQPKTENPDQLSAEEIHDLPIRENEMHFFCLNAEDLANIHSLTKYHFGGGHEHLYDLLQSKPVVKHFQLKTPSSFRAWNTLVQLSQFCLDTTVMALNKDRIVSLALELELNPAILPDLQCHPNDFPTPEQLEWWGILGEDIKLYPVTQTDLIN